MSLTKTKLSTDTKLERIAWLSRQDSTKEFRSLMHHFNVELLKTCYQEIDCNKAVGIDRIDKETYGKSLSENLEKLVYKMKQMSYRPGNIRQVMIPKADKGELRPLGISNFEDKLVQKMMQKILESIYEPIFLENSYGFRRNRSCHDAIKKLHHHLFSKTVRVV